jgi:hypothetical protein
MALNITKEVANMERLSVGALCERYREVFGEDTKARNKQWLIKRIAWKLQANEEGDISERARKLAMEIAQSSDIRTSAPKIRTRPIEATFETATTIITPPADSRLLTQQDVETAMTTFDPIWESMTPRDQINLVHVVVKQVDYDGESGRVTITFNPIGIKKRAEHATKDLEEARA